MRAFLLPVETMNYSQKIRRYFDADKWITVKPNGGEHNGAHVKIDGETGEVKAGMGENVRNFV